MSRIQLIFISLLIWTSTSAQNPPFTFAWLTDTHVGSSSGADDLRNSVHDINAQPDVSFVIVSGDVTELGSNSELTLAKQILDSLNTPYHTVPGNHDTKWSESGASFFRTLWKQDRFVFDQSGYRFIGLHEGPLMRMGDGHFAPEDVRWMDSVLAAMPKDDQPIIFVTHYPLDASIDNWYAITDRLLRYNIKAVLCGHGHANRVYNFEGIPGVMARSNLRGRATSSGYTLVTVSADTMFFSERISGTKINPSWYRLPLFPTFPSKDAKHTPRPEYSINQKYPAITSVWEVETGFTIASTPAVYQKKVIVGNSSGKLLCFDLETGKEQWSFESGSAIYSSPAAADDRVVFASTNGNIYCLSSVDGKILWNVPTGKAIVAAPVISEGIVYIGSSDGTFRALHMKDGSSLWNYKNFQAFVETRPLLDSENVIFGAWDTYLYALNRRTGLLSWKWSNGNSGRGLSPAACWPVASSGKIFIVAPDRVMTAIEAATGKTIWRSGAHQVRESIGISQDGKRVYAKSMNDTLFAFLASESEQKTVWSTICGFGYDIDPSMPIERDGIVYFGTKNGLVYALSAETGEVLWVHKISNTIVNTVTPVDQKRAIVSDFDGRLVLLSPKKP